MTNLKNEFLKIIKSMKFITNNIFKVFCLFMFLSSCQTKDNIDSPNVIFILTDDLGFADLSAYGSNMINTQNLNYLAKEGALLRSYYSSQAVCSASRASILTGSYPNRIGFSGALGPNSNKGINPNEFLMSEMFKQNGFKIIIFSGRNDRSFHTTDSWLKQHNVPFDLLVMRPDKFQENSWPVANGNPATQAMRFMPDEILKKAMLDTFVNKDNVFCVFDDRKKVVDMWRELGLTCFEVEEAHF